MKKTCNNQLILIDFLRWFPVQVFFSASLISFLFHCSLSEPASRLLLTQNLLWQIAQQKQWVIQWTERSGWSHARAAEHSYSREYISRKCPSFPVAILRCPRHDTLNTEFANEEQSSLRLRSPSIMVSQWQPQMAIRKGKNLVCKCKGAGDQGGNHISKHMIIDKPGHHHTSWATEQRATVRPSKPPCSQHMCSISPRANIQPKTNLASKGADNSLLVPSNSLVNNKNVQGARQQPEAHASHAVSQLTEDPHEQPLK